MPFGEIELDAKGNPEYRGWLIDLLDHGFIRLVDYMGSDESIVRNARVSYDGDGRTGVDIEGDKKLIKYLMKNGHNTPFEAPTITFDVKAPIFVFRQWHRHRTQSYNELSARYRPLPAEFYIPEAHLIGTQNKDNKQMRDPMTIEEYNALPQTDKDDIEFVRKAMQIQNEASFKTYENLMEMNVPRELARSVLPVATYSHMFATMNLHNLFRFLRERLHEHAQYEIRVYAQAMLEIVRALYPVAVEAFEETL